MNPLESIFVLRFQSDEDALKDWPWRNKEWDLPGWEDTPGWERSDTDWNIGHQRDPFNSPCAKTDLGGGFDAWTAKRERDGFDPLPFTSPTGIKSGFYGLDDQFKSLDDLFKGIDWPDAFRPLMPWETQGEGRLSLTLAVQHPDGSVAMNTTSGAEASQTLTVELNAGFVPVTASDSTTTDDDDPFGRAISDGDGVAANIPFAPPSSDCCEKYVSVLCWSPTPTQYPDIDPPRLAYEWLGPSGVEEGEPPLDLDGDGYPILYYIEDESSLRFAYLLCGVSVSVPHSAANSWLKAKAGAVSRSLSSYGYRITWEPPIKEYAPDTLFVRGPMVSSGARSPNRPDEHAQYPTTLPIVFYVRINGVDYKLKTMELRPRQTEHCGYIHFHDLHPDSPIAECEYNAAMNLHAKAMRAWREALEQWEAQPAETRGDRPTPPERPKRLPPPDASRSAFSDALQLTPNTQIEGDDEDAKILYDLLDQHRDDDGIMPDASIHAVAERTYGRWDFELIGHCPDCQDVVINDGETTQEAVARLMAGNDCKTKSVTARQGSFFNRSKPDSFSPSYIGDTATFTIAVLRVANNDSWYGGSVIGEYTARVETSGDVFLSYIAPQDGTLSATIDSIEVHEAYFPTSYPDDGNGEWKKAGGYQLSILGPLFMPDYMIDDYYTYLEQGRHDFEIGGYDRGEELETRRWGGFEVKKDAVYYFVVDSNNITINSTLVFTPYGD